ncbi:arginine deiminase [Alkalibaculum sp. M08DMB]|uniref:Arginine deiminase n=1 Tax=Alkalibaculum sporogenes TaxID=2655001 RepID=A0A6A7KBI7_9FIRM|nr:arginine deiminase [Alkalibaculum sporogenes]
MTENSGLNVYNEIGQLKSVLLHCPGDEVENIVPKYLKRLLFDEIIYLKQAQKEHLQFAKLMIDEGIEVLYLTDLMAQIFNCPDTRKQFLEDFMVEGNVATEAVKETLRDFFSRMSPIDMVKKCIAGVQKSELAHIPKKSLADIVKNPYPFYLDPIPNLYFQRDPFASMGHGVTLNVMSSTTRNRETLFAKYLFDYHPRFKDVPRWYNRDKTHPIEGGDILILSNKVIAIGVSDRTDSIAVEKVAKKLLYSNESFEVILAFDIPKAREFMHLDTVFTMVDYDKFTIYPGIENPLDVYSIKKSPGNALAISFESDTLTSILKKYLKLPAINLIRCGDGNLIAAGREQWSDGSNTLAIQPGKVICYDRNYITNEALRKNGIEVLEFESYELSRGRGGPRCMSMPLNRKNI